ncbi:LamG-like jellyroll fold domain-containing protein [Methanohalophilus mahii]
MGSSYGSRKFTGCIDELQIYNRAFSQAEIQSIGN